MNTNSNREACHWANKSYWAFLFAWLFVAMSFVGCSQERWIDVTPNSAGFTVSMPGQPAEQKQTVPSPSGALRCVYYDFDQREISTEYMVCFVTYPNMVMTNLSSERILSSGLQSMLSNPSVKFIKNEFGHFEKYPSKEFEFVNSTVALTTIGREILAGNRMYLIQVVTPNARASDRNVQRFINSFKLADKSSN